MKISVVIPAYNEEKYIGMTLESVKKLDLGGNKLEILVIDADSKDKTAKIALGYGAIVKHEPHKEIGFSRQQGIKHATGEIIAFTDADTIVPKDWLSKHLKVLNSPGVVCSCGVSKVFDGKFPYYHYINFVQIPLYWLIANITGKPPATGQNIAFWRKKALEIGGFNQKLRLFEDFDFADRMKQAGKVVFSISICVSSSGRRTGEGFGFFTRNIRLFTRYLLGDRELSKFPDYR